MTFQSYSLLLFFSFLLTLSLHGQKWHGQVSDGKLSFPATIINHTRHKITFATSNGRFLIPAEKGDSITVKPHPYADGGLTELDYSKHFIYEGDYGDTTFIWSGQDSITFDSDRSNPLADSNVALWTRPTFDKNQIIKEKNFTPGNRYDPLQLIQGKIPGVVISRPGGDPNYAYQMQIRGLHSAIYPGFSNFSTTNGYNEQFGITQPLVVVDGMPGVALNTVDPQDIESVEVIRDAASLSTYGMRGANGAIQITTRKGELYKNGVQYSSYVAFDQASKPDLGISADTYRNLTGAGGQYAGVGKDLGATTNWYAAISRPGFSHAHNLVLNGSSLKTAYRLSVNLREVNGIAKRSGLSQFNTLFNFQRTLGKNKGKLGGLFSITNRSTSEVNADIFRNAALFNPTAPVFSDTATRSGGYFQPNVYGLYNPVAQLDQQTFEKNYHTISAGLNWEQQFSRRLSSKVDIGYQYNREGYGWVQTPGVQYTTYEKTGSATWDERRLYHWYVNAGLKYEHDLNHGHLETELGYTQQNWQGRGLTREANFFNVTPPAYQPLITDNWRSKGWTIYEDRYQESDLMPAVYAKAKYVYQGNWFAQGSIRREGFTRLGDNKWANYPAVVVGGKIIQSKKIIDLLSFQLGYGETGNIPPKNYATHALLLPSNYVYSNGQYIPGIQFSGTPNTKLRPESRKEWNLGLYYHLLKNRVSGQIQFYRSRSSTLLWQYLYKQIDGQFDAKFENLLALVNRGVEVQINVNVTGRSAISWIARLNFAHNRTLFDASFPVNVPGQSGENQLEVGNVGGPGFCCGGLQVIENKKPIGQFSTYQADGIVNGQLQIRDLNQDGRLTTEDKTITGNAQPALTYGWDNNLSWKRFSLNVFWRGALGHRLFNTFNLFYANPQILKTPGYSIPAVALTKDFSALQNPTYSISNYFLEHASFIRLENLSLSYDLPFGKAAHQQKSIQFYVSVQNLLTISSFNGNDPEVRLSNFGTGLVPGIVNPNYFGYPRNFDYLDRGRYPLTQTWVFGLRFKQ
jgi:iron complex outermembrane receptor protein